jgi:Kef-type K+ transport system membrane component KefB
MQGNLDDLLVVVLVAALAPLIAGLVPGGRLPQVVVLILGGILVGPQVADMADPQRLRLLSDVGLGFLFLSAGYEVELRIFRERAGRLAAYGWFMTMAISICVISLLTAIGVVHAFIPVALGLSTTALGTLLPILRDNRMLEGIFGENLMAAGAVGEMFPVIAIAIFLGSKGKLEGLISLIAVGSLAAAVTVAPRLVRSTRLSEIIRRGQHATSQTTLRWTVVLLIGLLAVASRVGLDVVLGAFLAGLVLRKWAPGDIHSLERKLDAVGYGFFIPIFFVSSGMSLDVRSIVHSPGRLFVFAALLLAVRGLPSLLVYRNQLPLIQRFQMTFLLATALPLLVALSEIGLQSGEMLPANAAALVGAGVLSVAVFPSTAVILKGRAQRRAPAPAGPPVEADAPAAAAPPAQRQESIPEHH